ncbi:MULTISPECIES: helix-turn-helix domain-containing protein [Leuconostoc]|uniref:Antitoxin HipB n=1 Tax=Leuconostoc suionicum TaxID=1511761 RepID=A0A2N9KGF3_9LACO|nr:MULTISPECIES: helix-turn-helix transcriptional regulator [Leuconostoc]API71217.1 hypothetical protein A6B45_00340 [Leuconostoc suionicum]MDI6502691.1 helix-turn-helix transcriptional regulator [Leuconostoc suionicum]MDI6523547.1 helix-turn-helix transcriptional regulator [Leuconostoc suionicum]MDI6614620.1 helix-turn-helix transcriptional regulator [Leuconostoc suionicum]MDI6665510.1 helix-turn-helix transcriptional regulator [Leuconostoc suionicum]
MNAEETITQGEYDIVETEQLQKIYGGDLGEALKYYRQAAGLTARELSRKMNITPAALSNYENNKRRPDLEFVRDVAHQLDLSIDTLLESM